MPTFERVASAPMHQLLGGWVPPLPDPVNSPRLEPLEDPGAPPTRVLTQPVSLPPAPPTPVVEREAPSLSPIRIDLIDAIAWIHGRQVPLSQEAHSVITQHVLAALEADDAAQRSRLRAALLPESPGMAMPAPGEPGPPVVS